MTEASPMVDTDRKHANTTDYGADGHGGAGGADELLAPGTVIAERYCIGERLGRGGMGAVYSAEHLTVGRSVAVKVLATRWCDSDDVVRRFRDEARAASAAGHPNIIEVFDAGDLPDGRPYIVMEHLEGRELADVIHRHGPLAVERACRIARDVARALDAAHARGVIHRDLKGENVMLVERGGEEIVKVLDFGIAANNAVFGPRLTTPGLVMGTPAAMAPEQILGKPAKVAFDIYALGVLLHHALTGHTPFEDEEGLGVLAAKTGGPAPSIATLRGDLPVALVELVDSCLALDASLRPATAREVAERLLDIVEEQRVGARAAAPVALPLRSTAAVPSRRRALVPIAVAIGLLTLGVGALVLRDPSSSAPARADAELPLVGPLEGPMPVEPPIEEGGAPSAAAEPSRVPTPAGPEPARAEQAPPVPVANGGPPAPVVVVAEEPPASADSDASMCWRTRKRAEQARGGHDWSGVLRHTRNQGCWAEHRESRRRLRAKAFMELRQWDACVEASRGLGDAEGRQWQETCRRRREQG